MSNDDMVISHSQGGWSAVHAAQMAGGPQRLSVGQHLLLTGFHNRLNESSDEHLLADKGKVFRKGGSAVFAGEGHLPGGAGTGWRHVVRYAGNTARITCDFSWKGDALLESGVEIGSLTLPGMWEKVQILEASAEQTELAEPETRRLQIGKNVRLEPFPLALLFYGVHGGRLEVGLGGDLWRWHQGLGAGLGVGGIRLECRADGVTLRRFVATAAAEAATAEEAVRPAVRDYRFTSYLAWRAPLLRPAWGECAPCLLSLQSGELSRQQLEDCGPSPDIALDFSELPLPHQARRRLAGGTPGAPCWESRITQKAVRKVIRQLAEYSGSGRLLVCGGAVPGVCSDPVHCSRKAASLHWDMVALIDAFSWMQQRLGDGWQIGVRQPGFWEHFPAAAQLGAPNGFRTVVAEGLEFADDAEE